MLSPTTDANVPSIGYRRLARGALIAAASLVIASCGSGAETVETGGEATDGSSSRGDAVGELAPPERLPFDSTSAHPAIDQLVYPTDCTAAAKFVGVPLFELPPGLTQSRSPLCFIEDWDEDSGSLELDRSDGEPYNVGILYVPSTVDPSRDNLPDALAAGAILVAISDQYPAPTALPSEIDRDSPGGGVHPVEINGAPGAVRRVREDRVSVIWHHSAGDGRVLSVQISGDMSPGEAVAIARQSAESHGSKT